MTFSNPLFDANNDECFDPGGDIDEIDVFLEIDDSFPEYETFCFNIEEKSSGSTTTHSDYSLPDYDAFYFDDNHIEEKSSGSTTTHSDFSLPEYDSFIFDLSINLFPPVDRSVSHHEEFANELAHIISPTEYDRFTLILRSFQEISFPSGNEDMIFDPRIFIIKRVQYKRFQFFPLDDFPTFSFVSDSLLLIDPSEIETFLSFPSGNEDKDCPDYEDSRAHDFVHRSLKLQSLACLYMGIRYPRSNSAGGKLRDQNAEESWALLEDLALYDNESWNDLWDFAKLVKAISLPQDVPSTSDRHLIELENQVQRLMEAHIAPKQHVQVNKISSSCEICSGRGFLATTNAVIDCRKAKIAVGEGMTRSVFGVKETDPGEEEAPYWTTLRKRESYRPRPSLDGIGAQTSYYARKEFMDCHLPEEWEIARDAQINPFKDFIVFRRMVEFLGAFPRNLKGNIWESEDLIDKPIN
ncbi:hypothetical protein Tco_0875245 [Tanacetum coccineum]|uniref:Uncharacterized protein n=1 Tax=Tanacetum coccineum TaxID=301880 RepID=A0ABQ5BUL3_9ASTR